MSQLKDIIISAHYAIHKAVKDLDPRPEEFELKISLNAKGDPVEHNGLAVHTASLLVPIKYTEADGPAKKK